MNEKLFLNGEKAKQIAKQHTIEYSNGTIEFTPIRKVVEGFDCYQITNTNYVIPYDENQIYPIQEIERVIRFKR